MKKIEILHDARMVPTNGLYGRNVLPFMGVQYDVSVDFGRGRKFRVITYQAYNAHGLIGSERNGVALLDETNKRVVFDELAQQSTGWFGASQSQFDAVYALATMDWAAFRKSVNSTPRLRREI